MTSSNCSWIPANDLDECGLNIHDCSFNAKSGFFYPYLTSYTTPVRWRSRGSCTCRNQFKVYKHNWVLLVSLPRLF